MSSSMYFYRLVDPGIEPADGVIDLDRLDYDTPYVRDDGDVPEWVAEHGVYATLRRDTVDLFALGEELFGQRPTSISSHSFDYGTETFHFPDGSAQQISQEEMEQYYTEERFPGYVYGRECIGKIENAYMIEDAHDWDEKHVEPDAARRMLAGYMDANREDLDEDYAGDYYLRPVYVLAKVMFASEDETIVCEVC